MPNPTDYLTSDQAASRPVLFSGPMVQAILTGRKTQTRRVIKPQPADDIRPHAFPNSSTQGWISSLSHHYGWDAHFCPYGKAGDHLWVRETWQTIRSLTVDEQLQQTTVLREFFDGKVPANEIVSKVKELPLGTGEPKALYAADFGEWAYDVDSDLKPWRPSIHMPRWASRITLEILSVRVERVQDINEEDAKAEGVEKEFEVSAKDFLGGRHIDFDRSSTFKLGYKHLWGAINGKKHPWASNPWVWVIEFRRANA